MPEPVWSGNGMIEADLILPGKEACLRSHCNITWSEMLE